MNKQWQQRLVGFLVLGAIVAIVLPWLLHHSHSPMDMKIPLSVPPAPKAPQVSLELPSISTFEQQLRVSRASHETPPPAQSVPVSSSAHKSSAKPAPAVAKEPAALRPLHPKAWTLQVATFRQPRSARSLVSRLRKQGFDVYTQQPRHKDQKMVTVYIGPSYDKQQLLAIQQQLQRQANLHPKLKQYKIKSNTSL